MPTWLKDRALTVQLLEQASEIGADDVVGHAQRLRGNRQRGVDRGRRRKERGVDDEEILDVVGAAKRIEDRGPRIRSETKRAALVRRVLRPGRVGEDFRRPVAEPL